MILELYTEAFIGDRLVPRTQLLPYPPAGDRSAWEGLPDQQRQELVARGEQALVADWPSLPASLFLEFVRTGNRHVYEARSFPRRDILTSLVLAECVEGKGRFLDAIVDAAWAICEESFWGISAHVATSKGTGLPDTASPVVDLFAAETGATMAWTVYLLGEELGRVTPQIVPRILRETKLRILDPCLERDDFWWMGLQTSQALNNWTPWICSNWLTAALLLDPDEDRRAQGVLKAVQCLDRYLSAHPADGGCDEGPGYWGRAGASTYDCAEILGWATKGAVRLASLPLVKNMGSYIHNVHIDEDRFVNFADASPTSNPNGALCVRFGLATENPALVALGRYFQARAAQELTGRDIARLLPALFATPAAEDDANAPYPRDAWLPDTQVMAARCHDGSPTGFFVAAKGGHNAESHNHNDVGNVVVYRDGLPLLVDAGVGTYSAKTFSSRRYEIWTMQSIYHNLPTIDGKQQYAGRTAKASHVSYHADDRHAEMNLDLASAYPRDAGLRSWWRTVTLIRDERVEILDRYDLAHQPGSLEWSFVTACRPVQRPDGVDLLAPDGSQRGRLTFASEVLASQVEEVALDDGRLRKSWPNGLWRIRLRALHPRTTGTVLFRLYAAPSQAPTP
jgi:hypothetical protein